MKEMELSHIVNGPQPIALEQSHSTPKLLKREKLSLANKKSYPPSMKNSEGTIMSKLKCETSLKPGLIASQTFSSAVSARDPIIEERKSIKNIHNAIGSVSISESSTKLLDRDQCKEATFQDPIDRINDGCDISDPKDDSSGGKFPLFSDVECIEDGCIVESSFSVRANGSELPNSVFEKPVYSSKNGFLSILNSFPPEALVSGSRKKLLILDINGILADIVYPPPKGYSVDMKIVGRAIFRRPFCYDFLNFCLERFNVAIWSSRSKKIMDRVVHYLMGDMKQRLMFCWDISYCTESKFKTLENRHKTLVFKELRTLWEINDSNLPWDEGDYDESNTLLLDDSPYKALLNPPHTAIFPNPFNFRDQADNAIGPGGNLRAYLERLAMAENVQKYIEHHPFGQSAITERSLSWRFYSKVIEGQYAVAS